MSETCPLCEKPFTATTKIQMGDGWDDTFIPPHSLFTKYKMIHVAEESGGAKRVFLHKESDLRENSLP